jgi:hypothetical protein
VVANSVGDGFCDTDARRTDRIGWCGVPLTQIYLARDRLAPAHAPEPVVVKVCALPNQTDERDAVLRSVPTPPHLLGSPYKWTTRRSVVGSRSSLTASSVARSVAAVSVVTMAHALPSESDASLPH